MVKIMTGSYELEGTRKETFVVCWKYYYSTLREQLSKTKKNVYQDIRPQIRDSKSGPLKHEARVIPARWRRSANPILNHISVTKTFFLRTHFHFLIIPFSWHYTWPLNNWLSRQNSPSSSFPLAKLNLHSINN